MHACTLKHRYVDYGIYIMNDKIFLPSDYLINRWQYTTEANTKSAPITWTPTNKNILSYTFSSAQSIKIHIILQKMNIMPEDKFIIFGKTHIILDGLLYHLKFYKFIEPVVDFYLFWDNDKWRNDNLKSIKDIK